MQTVKISGKAGRTLPFCPKIRYDRDRAVQFPQKILQEVKNMAFVKEKGSFLSADGKTAAACYFYRPAEGRPCGVVQISHGMCEYLERYEEFAAFLCEAGFVVCGNDHLGHGRTAAPSERGFFAERDGDFLLVEDLHRMTKLAKERFPDAPYFLFGHSMGSFIARRYLVRYGEELDGAVICGTAGSNPAAKAGSRAAAFIAACRGSHYRSGLLEKMAFGAYNRRFPAEEGPHAWLSRDRNIVRRYDADPLCNFRFTAAGFRDLLALLCSFSGPRWAQRVPKELPILLTAGEEDPVGSFGKGVREVDSLLREAGVRDLTMRLYPGARHEILNETNRREVYADILDWLSKRCGRTGTV